MTSLSLFPLLPEHLFPFKNHIMESLQAVPESISYDGTGWLQMPGSRRAQFFKREHFLNFNQSQTVSQVLFVGHHQQGHPLVFRCLGDFMELRFGLLHALWIHRVHHKYDAVRASRVWLPEGAQLLLTPNVPEVERHSPVAAQRHFDLLSIKTFGGHGVDKLIELQSVQNGGLPCRVQPKDGDVKWLEERDARDEARLFRQSIAHLSSWGLTGDYRSLIKQPSSNPQLLLYSNMTAAVTWKHSAQVVVGETQAYRSSST